MTQEDLFESYYVEDTQCTSSYNEDYEMPRRRRCDDCDDCDDCFGDCDDCMGDCNVIYDCEPDNCNDETDCRYDD